MCNRSINVIDIEIMNGHAWELKEFKIIGVIGSGMTVRAAKDYLGKEEVENKEV